MMNRPLRLAILCSFALLSACGKHNVTPTSEASKPQSTALAESGSPWDRTAASSFEKADTGSKAAFLCAMPRYFGTAAAHANDPSIGFELVTPNELRVSATTPAKAVALIATAARRPNLSTGCYSDVSAHAQPRTFDSTAVYADFQSHPEPYLLAEYARLQPSREAKQMLVDALAPAGSNGQTTDVFKQQAALQSAQAKATAMLAIVKTEPYANDLAYIRVGHFDLKRGTFTVQLGFGPTATRLDLGGKPGTVDYVLNGPASELTLHPASTQVAHAFESFVSTNPQIAARMHLTFVGIGQFGPQLTVEGWVLGYDIVDAQQKTVFTVDTNGTLKAA